MTTEPIDRVTAERLIATVRSGLAFGELVPYADALEAALVDLAAKQRSLITLSKQHNDLQDREYVLTHERDSAADVLARVKTRLHDLLHDLGVEPPADVLAMVGAVRGKIS